MNLIIRRKILTFLPQCILQRELKEIDRQTEISDESSLNHQKPHRTFNLEYSHQISCAHTLSEESWIYFMMWQLKGFNLKVNLYEGMFSLSWRQLAIHREKNIVQCNTCTNVNIPQMWQKRLAVMLQHRICPYQVVSEKTELVFQQALMQLLQGNTRSIVKYICTRVHDINTQQ